MGGTKILFVRGASAWPWDCKVVIRNGRDQVDFGVAEPALSPLLTMEGRKMMRDQARRHFSDMAFRREIAAQGAFLAE